MPNGDERRPFHLRAVLKRLGMSQRKLAKILDVTQDWVSRIHNDRNLPTWPTAVRIAEALGVSVGVFREGDEAFEKFFKQKAGAK